MAINYAEVLANPNMRKFLDLVSYTEGTGKHGYHTLVGGKRIESLSKHPNVVGIVTKDGKSTAFGRYQITYSTYKDVASKVGVTDMSPQSQDKLAVYLLNRAGGLSDILAGNFTKGISKARNVWVSFPNSKVGQREVSTKEIANFIGSGYTPSKAPGNYNSDGTDDTEEVEPPQIETPRNVSFASLAENAMTSQYPLSTGIGVQSNFDTLEDEEILAMQDTTDDIEALYAENQDTTDDTEELA